MAPICLAALVGAAAFVQGRRQTDSKRKACRGAVVIRGSIAKSETSEALPFLTLTNAVGDTAKVYTYGACVASYVKDGSEVLALRKDGTLDGSKPIAGGIPICFPQFGPGPIQQHGFARDLHWTVAEETDGLEPKLVLKLADNEETRKHWDHAFEATYSVQLKIHGLEAVLSVKNTGLSSFDFTAALHAYWNVSNPANVKVSGELDGKMYLDKTQEPWTDMVNTGGDELEISEYTEAVYRDVTGDVTLEDRGKSSCLTLRSSGWSDFVIWSPWGNDAMGYESFLGLEPAQSSKPVTLSPSEEWVAKMDVLPSTL